MAKATVMSELRVMFESQMTDDCQAFGAKMVSTIATRVERPTERTV